ncbi:hypothetical protein A0H81_00552 [Grifola frondosa]|uniref:Uncharacterized protein n=1 Tax=Grifola frondosa TaxID=5627 RepID=A0A1C7MPM2_GRIFR|nr:hypothetical protein A0H81_00552 [Grifola frondosa]
MKWFHRTTEPWEIVERRTVEAVPMYAEDELEEIDVVRVADVPMGGTYVFDLRKGADLRRAVVFARQQLLQEALAKNYNVLLTEGYTFTHMRKGKRHRAEVRYIARPAHALGKLPPTPQPPFMAVLDLYVSQLA